MPTTRNIHPMPDGRYRVRFKLGKKERTKICATEKDAKDYIIGAKKGIFAAGQRFLTLTEKEQIRIMVLLEKASADKGYGHGITVFETAMKFYEENAPKDGIPCVSEAVEQLIVDWKAEGANHRYISNAGGVLRRFGKAHLKPIDKVTPGNVDTWLKTFEKAQRKTLKARISKLLSFSVVKGWIEINFCKDMQVARSKKKPILIPTFDEIDDLLSVLEVSEKYRPLLRPYSLRLYAGPRVNESLDTRVREEGGMLILPEEAAAKNGPARHFELPEAYMACAKWCDDKNVPLLDEAEFHRLDLEFRKERGIAKQAKWKNWQRHSYASYKLPLLKGNLDELAEQMGNSVQVLRNHYLGKVTPGDVTRFWARRPRG